MEMFLWVKQSCADRSYDVPLAPSLAAIRRRPAFREALIEGRLTGAALIEIYPDNNSLGIRPLAEEGLGDLENMTGGEGSNDESSKAGKMALR